MILREGLYLRRKTSLSSPKIAATPIRPASTQRCQISKLQLHRGCRVTWCSPPRCSVLLSGTPPCYRESDNRAVFERLGQHHRIVSLLDRVTQKREKIPGSIVKQREGKIQRYQRRICIMHEHWS